VRRRLDGDGDLRGARVGAQPQVGAEDIAMFIRVLQQAHQLAGDTDRDRAGILSPGHGHGVRIKEDDKINVARIVQFMGAMLAHGDCHVPTVRGGPRHVRQRQFAGTVLFQQQRIHCRRHCRVGKPGEPRRDLRHVPCTAHVGHGQERARPLP
jgi:hypothetical protein